MASPLDNIQLPYPDDATRADPGNAPPAPAPAPVAAAPTHPDVDKIKLPYNDSTPAPVTTGNDSSGDSPLWNALQKPTTSISDLWDATKLTGRGLYDTARVFGNQAVVPHGFDRLMSSLPGSADYAAQAAETERAKKDLGGFTSPVEWAGQNYSAQGIANRAAGGNPIVSAVANNPITTGVVTGGGGTLAGGDTDWTHVIKNAATTALESKAGQAIGSGASIAAGYLGNTGKALYQKAQEEAQAALDRADIPGWTAAMQKAAHVDALGNLQNLYNKGGDVVGQAMNLANQTTGAASAAYQNIADAASKSTALPKMASAAVTGGMGWLTGGPAVGAVASGANEAANRLNKWADVNSAIDQAFPTVTGYVKSTVNPQNWRNAASSAAVTAGADYDALRNRAANFSIGGVLSKIPGASYLGY